MSAIKYKFTLKREISKLNKTIDRKIASGKSYRKEAMLHKRLLERVKRLDRRSSSVLALF